MVPDRAKSSGYERLWATVREWSTASRRVLARVGFIETERQEVRTADGTMLGHVDGRAQYSWRRVALTSSASWSV